MTKENINAESEKIEQEMESNSYNGLCNIQLDTDNNTIAHNSENLNGNNPMTPLVKQSYPNNNSSNGIRPKSSTIHIDIAIQDRNQNTAGKTDSFGENLITIITQERSKRLIRGKLELESNVDEDKRNKDRITKHFIRIFMPMYYFNAMFFIRKYSMKNNNLALTTKIYIFGNVIINVVVLLLCYVTIKEFLEMFVTPFVINMYMVIYFQYNVQFVIICLLRQILKHDNLQLIKKLAELYNFFYLKKDILKIQMVLLIPSLIYAIAYTILITMKLSLDPLWSWYRGLFIFSTIIFDLEMVYAAFVLYFLSYNTRQWTEAVTILDDQNNEEYMNKMVQMFQKLVDGMRLAQKVFQGMVFYHFVTGFTQTLCYLEILLMWMNNKAVDTEIVMSHMLGVMMWIMKGLAVETALCICGEILYRRIENAKCVTISKTSRRNCKTTRRLAKNILRICNTQFSKMNACGVFTIDAALPLRLAGVVATYTVVLLQFAFL